MRGRYGGEGDELHFGCGGVRGLWRETWEAEEPWALRQNSAQEAWALPRQEQPQIVAAGASGSLCQGGAGRSLGAGG